MHDVVAEVPHFAKFQPYSVKGFAPHCSATADPEVMLQLGAAAEQPGNYWRSAESNRTMRGPAAHFTFLTPTAFGGSAVVAERLCANHVQLSVGY